VVRRRAPVAPVLADGVEPVLPRELTYYDQDSGRTFREHHRAKAEWLRSHGVDPTDWRQLSPVLLASKRAHARTPAELAALDRQRLIVTGAQADPP
jgi:hypothetical protein